MTVWPSTKYKSANFVNDYWSITINIINFNHQPHLAAKLLKLADIHCSVSQKLKGAYSCHELVSDVGIVVASPEFKGHPSTQSSPTGGHEVLLHWLASLQWQRVTSLVGERWTGDAQSGGSAIGMKRYLQITTCSETQNEFSARGRDAIEL